MRIIRKYSLVISGVVLGAIAGFLYWNYVGCTSGQCMITSVWYNSTIYGSIIGGLIGSSMTKKETQTNDKTNQP